MVYEYPLVSSGGYRWNMLQRIYNAIGLEPIGSGDANGKTFLQFSRELTEEEKETVDTIMASNPTYPPAVAGTCFVVKDVWNKRLEIGEAIGMHYHLYYSESVPNSGDVDQIELHFSEVMTEEQKQKVVSEFGKLISVL